MGGGGVNTSCSRTQHGDIKIMRDKNTKYKENIGLTELAALSQNMATQLHSNLTKHQLDTQKVKAVQKLIPKQSKTENQIGSIALERSVI